MLEVREDKLRGGVKEELGAVMEEQLRVGVEEDLGEGMEVMLLLGLRMLWLGGEELGVGW